MTSINLTATLTSPLHHGAGTSGNTALLRTQDVLQPDGRTARVPYLSANSVRHGLRDALAWHTVKTLDIQPGTLTKAQVDLLWSGGAVTTTGAQTDLDMLRRVEEHLPWLAMLGYAALSDIVAGTLRVQDMILECTENASRIPATTDLRPAAHYRGETFGTRMDQATSPAARLVELTEEAIGTTQMIYSIQVLQPGSVLHGSVSLTPAATHAHEEALHAALAMWAPGGVAYLGAKTAVGYGRAELAASEAITTSAVPALTQRILDHGDDILTVLGDLAR